MQTVFPVHIVTNNQQMGNKLRHVLFPYKVSNITQDFKKTALILKPHSGPVEAVVEIDMVKTDKSIFLHKIKTRT